MALEYHFVLPPTGQADNAIVREMFDDIRAYVNALVPAGGAAPIDAQYLTLATNATLTVERVLTSGTGIGFTDNGAGSTLVVTNTGVTNLSTTNINSSFSAATGAITFSFATTPTFTSIILGLGNQIGITPSASAFTSYNLTLPLNTGTSGYVLTTNGATPTATLSWTDINGTFATTTLNNLGTTAANASLIPGASDSIDLGTAAKYWKDVYVGEEIVFHKPADLSTVLLVKPPSGLSSWTFTFPTTAGTVDYVLRTDGSGNTSWVPQPGSGTFATIALDNLTTTAINVSLKPDTTNNYDLGSNSKAWKELSLKGGVRLLETGVGTDTVLLQAPSSLASGWDFTFPTTGGTNGYVLTTNGSGVTSWTDPGTFPTGANTALSNLASVAINTSLLPASSSAIDLGSTSKVWNYAYINNIEGHQVILDPSSGSGFIQLKSIDFGTSSSLTLQNKTFSASRIYSYPDVGAAADFVMTEGTQTIAGIKSFTGTNTLFNITSTRTFDTTAISQVQIEGTDLSTSSLALTRNANSANGPVLYFGKSRGTVTGSSTVVSSGDTVGSIIWVGADGTDLNSRVAMIRAEVDGTPGDNDMPGRLSFHTTVDGAVGVTEALRIDSKQCVTQPLQPSFLVTDGTGASNVTGDGTTYTELWPTEVFDQGANFASNTFTAPVTGRYFLQAQIWCDQIAVGMAARELIIVTSNRSYENHSSYALAETKSFAVSALADMDAGDTATVTIRVAGGTKVVDILNNGTINFFSGSLIN